ncbi:MAG: hypothetical protein ACR652_17000 [Methylocystis sp.]|uniref:hypothetical protein n=1 Tax=Methylocystis sp. TaxID=1911079 RepID=UPI003DA4557D
MSVEKIGALTQATTDATAMRAVNGFGPGHGQASPPFPPPADAPAGAPPLYGNLVLPLPKTGADGVPSSRISASYRTQAAQRMVESLSAGRLPEPLIRREVETLLRRLAGTREMTIARLIEETGETAPERLPSRNSAEARFDFRSRLAATDDDGRLRLFDLYLTRIGPRQWEAAIFERDPSRAGLTFPRATPPLEAHRLLIDPTTGAVVACVALAVQTGASAAGHAAAFGAPLRSLASAALAAALFLLIARVASWPAAALVLTALVMFLASER